MAYYRLCSAFAVLYVGYRGCFRKIAPRLRKLCYNAVQAKRFAALYRQ